MQIQKILVPVGALVLAVAGYRAYGWQSLALMAGGIAHNFNNI